jgi:MFS family permease
MDNKHGYFVEGKREGFHVAVTIHFIGCVMGSVTMRYLIQRIGRRKPHLLSYGVLAALLIARVYSSSMVLFFALTWFIGFFIGCTNVTNQAIMQEYNAAQHMGVVGLGCNAGFAFGYLLVVLIGAYSGPRSWVIVSWFLGVLNAIVVAVSAYVLHESPRWLDEMGRTPEARLVLEAMADKGVDPIISVSPRHTMRTPIQVLQAFRTEIHEVQQSRIMTRTTIVLLFTFLTTSEVYYGMSYSAASYSDVDPYVLSTWYALQELPAFMIADKLCNFFGPRKTLITSLILCGLCVAIQRFAVATLFLLVIGKVFGTVAFTTTYIYSVTVIPVPMRTSGLRLASAAIGIGTTLIGPTRILSNELGGQIVVDLLWAGMCIVCACGLATLTETHALTDRPPLSISDVEVRHMTSKGQKMSEVRLDAEGSPERGERGGIRPISLENGPSADLHNLDQDDMDMLSMAVGFQKEKSFYLKNVGPLVSENKQ